MTSEKWIRLIGLWQVLGGAISAAVFLDTITPMQRGDDKIVTTSIVVCVCGFSILTGRALLLGNAAGIRPSILVWVCQLFVVAYRGIGLQVSLGPYLYLGLTSNWLGVQGGFEPKMIYSWTSERRPLILAVNLLAIFSIAVLRRARRRHDELMRSDASAQSAEGHASADSCV